MLSLVRSNTKGKIGFLSEDNRLVVGTSRQQCALYIVGNHNFLEKSSPRLWKVCEYTSILNNHTVFSITGIHTNTLVAGCVQCVLRHNNYYCKLCHNVCHYRHS